MRRLVPKNCIVHRIELDGNGHAEVGFRCERDGYMETGQYSYPSPSGGTSNYPAIRIKANGVSFRGMNISGKARIGFVLSPASAVCSKPDRGEITCKLIGNTSQESLRGSRRKRRRR